MPKMWIYNEIEYVPATKFAYDCGVTVHAVYYWIKKGLPHVKLDRIYMIPYDQGMAWVNKNAPKTVK
jgi:hypothetical protein